MPRAGLTTERVVTAAADLADEVGFEAVTVSAVARHFDVKVASLYSHVAGSDDLRTRIALLAFAELADHVAEAIAGRSGHEALSSFAGAYRDYAHRHPGRYAAMRMPLRPEVATAGAGRRHAELTRAVLRGYDVDGEAEPHAVRLIGSVLHGYISLELAGSFDHSEPSSAESWPQVIEAVDTLLRGWSRA
jgi:AcrR family transcriptional regulator